MANTRIDTCRQCGATGHLVGISDGSSVYAWECRACLYPDVKPTMRGRHRLKHPPFPSAFAALPATSPAADTLRAAAIALLLSMSDGRALIAGDDEQRNLYEAWPELDALVAALDAEAPAWRIGAMAMMEPANGR